MILVTGGCGYIGSHFILQLVSEGKDVVCIDNLSNSNLDNLLKINQVSKKEITFVKGNVENVAFILDILKKYKVTSVAHFAGHKSILESIKNPIKYFQNNVIGSLSLINAMSIAKVNKIIFSSSATVYSERHSLPWNEYLHNDYPKNPYAQSKFMVENFLKNLSMTSKEPWSIGVLRYFNPIGCHRSGIIGENITSTNTNLIPAIIDVILNKKEKLYLYGNDYDTFDGSCVRDYIHIDDLILGHQKALDYISKQKGYNVWNLGSGRGYSVFEIIREFEKVLKKKIPLEITKRRKGDLPCYWADVSKAKNELNWNAKFELKDMINDVMKQIITLE
tara:strand:+ start:76 stop:1077 length:1002 start_codon:yes stop_codon:yes gene_type:complete